MDKIETWLEPTSHKILAALIAILAVFGATSLIARFNEPKELDPIVITHVFEYGPDGVNYEQLKPLIPINDDKGNPLEFRIEEDPQQYIGRYNVSFQLKGDELKKIHAMNPADASDFGSNKVLWEYIETIKPDNVTNSSVYYKILGEKFYGHVEIKYYVIDTQAPVFENPTQDIELDGPQDIKFEVAKAYDPIDGEVLVTWEGNYDTKVPGVYPIKEIAIDKNGNKTINTFTLTVLENE